MAIGRRTAFVLALLVSAPSLGRAQAFAQTAPAAAAARVPGTPQPDGLDQAHLGQLLERGETLFTARRYDEAEQAFTEALATATTHSLDLPRARAMLGLANITFFRRVAGKADTPAREALALFERLGDRDGIARASHLVSLIADQSGNRDEARRYAEQAVAHFAGSSDFRGRARATLQLMDLRNAPQAEAIAIYERLVRESVAAGDARMEASALQGMADRLFTVARFDEALPPLQRAVLLVERIGDVVQLGSIYNSLGRLYRAHGRYEEALQFQLKALGLHEKGNDPYYQVQSSNAVAVVYGLLGDRTRSREYYERALAVADRMGRRDLHLFLRANIAVLLSEEGRFAEAVRAYEEVIAAGRRDFLALRYGQLAYAYLGLGKPREALDAAEQAVKTCGNGRDICSNSLLERARAHAALGDLPKALTDIERALADLDALRARLVPTDFFKQNFPRVYEQTYGVAVALQLQAGDAERGLETAERARARAFLDLLAVKQLAPKDGHAHAPTDSSAAAIARDTPDSPATVTLTMRGAETMSLAATASPSPTRPTGSTEASTLARLATTAARLQSTLLSYWVADDELFIWAVSPTGAVQSRRVKVLRATLEGLVRNTGPFGSPDTASGAIGTAANSASNAALTTRGAMTVALRRPPADAWRALHALLIAPIRDALPRTPGSLLTIVPHGPLLNLSFAALQDARGRYLLEDFALHYAPAGALLDFTAARRRADARTGLLLLVSDPEPPQTSGLDRPLPRLPGARLEARAIGRLLPRPQVIALQGAAATETDIRHAAAHKAVLHFATHAIVRDTDPFASYLALGRSATGGDADGRLTAEEIYGLDLDADLVVLSACRSGGGTVTGDGVSTFARAFTYAGTASVLASVWDVADEPTNRLLPEFYRVWLGGAAKARALRRAQLSLLRDLRAGRVQVATPIGPATLPEHPVFWAGFALFGEPD